MGLLWIALHNVDFEFDGQFCTRENEFFEKTVQWRVMGRVGLCGKVDCIGGGLMGGMVSSAVRRES